MNTYNCIWLWRKASYCSTFVALCWFYVVVITFLAFMAFISVVFVGFHGVFALVFFFLLYYIIGSEAQGLTTSPLQTQLDPFASDCIYLSPSYFLNYSIIKPYIYLCILDKRRGVFIDCVQSQCIHLTVTSAESKHLCMDSLCDRGTHHMQQKV